MKNILFIHSSAELYGSDRSLLNILRKLDKTKYKAYVILPCQGPLLNKIEDIGGIEVIIYEVAVLRRKNLSIKGGYQYIKQYRKSVKFIKSLIKEKDINIQ